LIFHARSYSVAFAQVKLTARPTEGGKNNRFGPRFGDTMTIHGRALFQGQAKDEHPDTDCLTERWHSSGPPVATKWALVIRTN
jgi:hypothetical protein